MSLLSIPRDIWFDKVLHFLSFKEIVRTHSAAANAADRAAFENCIDGWCGAESVLVGGGQHVQIGGMKARNLHTSSVVLTKGFILDRLLFLMPHLKQVAFRVEAIENEAHLEQVIRQCTLKLTALDVSKCQRITGEGLIRGISQCTQLTSLSVRLCHGIDCATLAAALKTCPNLRHFTFTHVDLEAVLLGLVDGPKLTSLECHTNYITQTGLVKIAEYLPQLQTLMFTGNTTMQSNNIDFSDILRKCDQLKCLHLTGVFQGANDSLLCFEGLLLPHMEELNVTEYRTLSDEGVTTMARACPNLRTLDVSVCLSITDGAISEVGKCCRSLTSLNTAHCNQLTDAAFATLNPAALAVLNIKFSAVKGSFASHVLGAGSALRELNVSNCAKLKTVFANSIACTGLEKLRTHHTKLSKKAWLTLSSKLPNIRHIEAAACPGLSDAAVTKIVSSAAVKYFNVFKCEVSDNVVAQYPCVSDTYPPQYEEYEE